jgi:hypothetical protein
MNMPELPPLPAYAASTGTTDHYGARFVSSASPTVYTADHMRAYGAACAAAEREACAKVAEDAATCLLPSGSFLSERCAAAIRARSVK